MSGTFNTSFGTGQFGAGSSGSERNGHSDYKKIFCAYHSTEFLTNFCTDRECLMPLCPTCVVEHTEQHYQRGQKPTYVNLHDALHDARQYCYSSIVKLEEFDRRNVELNNYIHGLSEYIRKQLGECKEKLFLLIEERFQTYETKLVEDIRNRYAEDGVYNRKECEDVKDFITHQIQNLYDKISHLKGDQCLAALIRYYENDGKALDQEMNEVADYVQRNRKAGGLYIFLNVEEAAKELDGICERAVSVQYIQEDAPSMVSAKNLEASGGKKGLSMSGLRRGGGESGVKGSGVKGSGVKGSGVKGSGVKGTSKVLSYSSQKNQAGYGNY